MAQFALKCFQDEGKMPQISCQTIKHISEVKVGVASARAPCTGGAALLVAQPLPSAALAQLVEHRIRN